MTAHLPPVHRSVRTGGILLVLGSLQFIAAMIVAQLYYANYSLVANHISDLGNTALSPAHDLFNISIVLLGLFTFAGLLLAWTAFPSGTGRLAGLGLLLVASLGAIGVGVFPENVNLAAHSLSALLVFLPGGLALGILGVSMETDGAWGPFRWFSIVLGLITLVALALYALTPFGSNQYTGLVERFIVAPILLWAIVVGGRLASLPIRAKRHLVPGV